MANHWQTIVCLCVFTMDLTSVISSVWNRVGSASGAVYSAVEAEFAGKMNWESKDLSFNVEEMNERLDLTHYLQHRKRVMKFLGTHPIFQNRHYKGMTLQQQRDLVNEQLKTFAHSGLLDFRDSYTNPSRWAGMEI